MRGQSLRDGALIGRILAERYQVLERLGEGAMGVVFKARHIKVGRTFAVKVLHPHLLECVKTTVRFDREAELAGRLHHANVVGVVDVGEIDGLRYMVMDYAEGPDLAQLLVEAPLTRERIIHLVRQILEGLYHAHEQGLIHRDLKPENVIVERDSHGDELPRIVDFGIAILREGGGMGDGASGGASGANSGSSDGLGRLTTNGLVLGTPHYMAPEQAVADPIDHRIDLFALGIVIYEMLSGRLPFDGSGAEIARANLLLDPPRISQRVPHLEVDPLLEAFARRLMAKKPSARPATAKAARELLDLIERDRPAAAEALGLPASTSLRIPAATQPVTPPRPSVAIWGPAADAPATPETTRLRATPASSEQLAPVVVPTSTAVLLVPAAVLPVPAGQPSPPTVLPSPSLMLASAAVARQPSPVSPGAPVALVAEPMTTAAMPVSAQPTLEVLPLATASAVPGMSEAPRAPLLQRDLQTAIRNPLDWPPERQAPARRWLVTGIAGGAIAVVAALVLVSGGAPDAPTDRPVATVPAAAIRPEPSVRESPTVPATTAVAAAPEAMPPAIPSTAPPTGSAAAPPPAPTASDAVATPPRPPRRTRPSPPQEPRATDAPARLAAAPPAAATTPASPPPAAQVTPVPSPAPAPEGRSPDSRPTGTSPPDARPDGKVVAELYRQAATALDALPKDQAHDLRERLRRHNVLALMRATQPERDGAADELRQILRDARARKTALDGKPADAGRPVP